MTKKIISTKTIVETMMINNLDKREDLFEMMLCENAIIAKTYSNDELDNIQYASVPDYLIPIYDDGYKKQNTMLVCMYVLGVKRLNLNLLKINELFGTEYKRLAEAKSNLFDWCWEELGFNCFEVKIGRRISHYQITPNYDKLATLVFSPEESNTNIDYKSILESMLDTSLGW